MRPSSADTSEPAWVKRKMLSTKNSTSWPWSRKYSATVSPDRPTRARAPGGSFIWPYTSAHFDPAAEPLLGSLFTPEFDHLVIEVVALARALADAGEHRVAAMRLGDVVDQLHDQHGLADAGAAEQADLAALGVRREQVDDLDAGDEDLGLGGLIDIGGSRRVDRPLLGGLDGAGLVDRLAHHVHDAARASRRRPGRRSARRYRPPPGRAPGLRSNPWRWCARCSRRDAGRLRARAGCRDSAVSSAFRISGNLSSNCTSTTAPMTWRTWPIEPS